MRYLGRLVAPIRFRRILTILGVLLGRGMGDGAWGGTREEGRPCETWLLLEGELEAAAAGGRQGRHARELGHLAGGHLLLHRLHLLLHVLGHALGHLRELL